MAAPADMTIYPRLKGKNVVITGASAGIGEASAVHFAACGSNLVLLARRYEKLEKLKKDIEVKYGVNVFIFKMDVANKDDWKKLEEAIPDNFKNKIDILVNNAGKALKLIHITQYNLEDVNEMIDVNIKGVFLAIQAFVPEMKKRGEGHIINLSSIAGKQAYVNGGIYCATKFALEALTDTLRQELVDTPLRVTKISPGSVKTEFALVRYGGDKATADKVYEGYDPLVSADIADNIVYVASRPPHVQIADMLIFPTAQASATVIHRKQT